MDKVESAGSEKSAIEGTWNAGEKTRPKARAHLVFELVLEARNGPENGVEVVPRKIIQKHLIFGWLLPKFPANRLN